MPDDPKTLYLIDGHAQFFRAYYAIRPGMTSPVTHEPTNMTFGFVGMLLKLLRDQKPDYLAVVIDASGDRGTFRSQIYPEYKANRDEPPDDFRPQVERCLSVLEAMHVPVIAVEEVEADDVIATLARSLHASHPDLNIRVVSRDKDLTQIIRPGVELFDPHKDEIVTPETIFKTEGVTPDQVVDVLALMGDTVDNVPGVAGIGPKTAAKLIMEYGSIDNLLASIEKIKGKRRENLEAARDQLPVSRELVKLKDDLPLEFDLEAARNEPKAIPVPDLAAIFRELGFNAHQETLKAIASDEDSAELSKTNAARGFAEPGLFDTADAGSKPVALDANYQLISDEKALDELIERVRQAGECAIDTETDSLAPMSANLCGISVSIKSGEAFYIPTRSPAPETHLDTNAVIARVKPILEHDSIAKIGHNIKYDLLIFRRHGIDLRGIAFDTMIASYVVDATRSSHKMDVLALALLEYTCIPITDLIGTGKKQKGFDEVPLELAVPYAAEDADITLRLRDVLSPQIDELGLRDLFDDMEMPLVEVLAALEHNGIRVDPDELDRQREKLQERIESLRQSIVDASPHAFNPDSPKQLAAALFNKPDQEPPGLGLKVLRRGKTGPSTDVEVLERLAADPEMTSPVPELIVEYRQLTKLVNTYLVALKECIHPETGRVHASFNQTVAATGRLSSSDPNLQNIPIRTEIGREIRRAFVAEAGCMLITADYSQIELRLLAHLANDAALIEAFHEGRDIHTAVAAEVFGVDPEDVTREQRDSAKMVNFGIVYGITPYGLSRRLGGNTSVTEAGQIIADYKARFASIDTFLAECIHQAESNGYVETILKRRRRIPQITSKQQQQRALGERMAINTVVQGSAADLIKLAMIDLHEKLPKEFPAAKMLLQIHDELVFEAPDDQAEHVRAYVVERMEQAMKLTVPLEVGSACSTSWIDAK